MSALNNSQVPCGVQTNSKQWRPAMAITDSSPPLVLTKKQAAKSLQVCERTITSLILSGKLRALRFGRNVRIDPADLEAFIASTKVGGSPSPVSTD
jgi:excisionase family DNA binding protein